MATLLLLDDDSRFRALSAALLEQRGHTVLQASRCTEARKILSSRAVDLMIVDALLPDGAGPDFIRARRASHGGGELVLLVSAFWKKELATVARDAGAQAWLSKPVSPAELLRRVDALVGGEPGLSLTVEGERELAELRARFAGELPSLLNGVQVAVHQLRARPQAPGVFAVARRRAHQLAGIAGSFGFEAIGNACAAIEEALVALQTGTSNALWARIDIALMELAPGQDGVSAA
jgi:CheY-like chemotaxis protein